MRNYLVRINHEVLPAFGQFIDTQKLNAVLHADFSATYLYSMSMDDLDVLALKLAVPSILMRTKLGEHYDR